MGMFLHYQQTCSITNKIYIYILSVVFCLFACLHLRIYSLSFENFVVFAMLRSFHDYVWAMYGHVLLVSFELGFLLWFMNLWRNCLNSSCW